MNGNNNSSTVHTDGNFKSTFSYSFCADLKYSCVNVTTSPVGWHGWLMEAYDQAIIFAVEKKKNKVVFNLKATKRVAWSSTKCWLHAYCGGSGCRPHIEEPCITKKIKKTTSGGVEGVTEKNENSALQFLHFFKSWELYYKSKDKTITAKSFHAVNICTRRVDMCAHNSAYSVLMLSPWY